MQTIDSQALLEKYRGKAEHTPPIPFDTLKTIYLEAFNRIGWQSGLMVRPEVIQAEDRLNEVWLECMEGQATIEKFKATLKEWEGIISGAIKEAKA